MAGRAETEKQAQALAEELCEQLGPAWKPVVWQNLGWRYRATCGYMSIYPAIGGQYHATFSTKPGGVGTPAYWATTDTYETPLAAMEAQLRAAAEFTADCLDIITEQMVLLAGQGEPNALP